MKETSEVDLEKKISDAVYNIEEDRAMVKAVLMDAIIYLKKNEENHKTTGQVVAKYFEALQRSNDQLIKIITIKEKNTRHSDEEEISSESLYDLIDSEKTD